MVKISHKGYKNVLLKKNCLRHSMNRIQSKNHRIETCEILWNQTFLSCFGGNIYILHNGYDVQAFGS